MYSFEELDYRALFEEVSEPNSKARRRLPFVKRKSSTDVAGEWARRVKERTKARVGSGGEKKKKRKELDKSGKGRSSRASASSTEEQVVSGRSGTSPRTLSRETKTKENAFGGTFLLDPSSDEDTSSAQPPVKAKASAPGSRTHIRWADDAQVQTSQTISKSSQHPKGSTTPTNNSSHHRATSTKSSISISSQSSEWRFFRPQQQGYTNGNSNNETDCPIRRQSVRTKGHRLPQLCEAVYDEKGQVVFQPLTLADPDRRLGSNRGGGEQKDYFVLRRGNSLVCKAMEALGLVREGEGGVFLVEARRVRSCEGLAIL